MEALLNYLKEKEGDYVHYNDGEKDITAPYGIYRHEHPNAKIFEYIDSLAEDIGVSTNSKEWDSVDIEIINKNINDSMTRRLARSFYKSYLKGAHLDLFPENVQVAMFSMYVNSELYSWKSVQDALDIINKNLNIINTPISKSDGKFGEKTQAALLQLYDYCLGDKARGLYFEAVLINCMKSYYIDLATDGMKPNPKYIKYLQGWDNRMNGLLMK